MLINGFDQSGTLFVKNRKEATEFYKTIFGMEEVYHHMEYKLQILDKFFFNIKEVSEEQHQAYMNAISSGDSILHSHAQYDTEDEVKKVYELLSAEALMAEELRSLPWCPLTAGLTDRYGISWYINMPEHMPCSDCKKPTCEGDWDSRCRLPKWTEELYKEHDADWYKYVK